MPATFQIEALNPNGLPITPPQDTRSEEGYMKDLSIEGTLQINIGGQIVNVSGTYKITDDGITFEGGSYNGAGSVIKWTDGASVTYGAITGGDIAGARVISVTGNASGYIRLSVGTVDPDEEQIKIYASYVQIGLGKQLRVIDTTEATSKDTGALIVEGGVGVEKNLHIGGNLNVTGSLIAPKVDLSAISDADSPFTVPVDSSYIATDSTNNSITVNLPAGTSGRRITIFDTNGSAAINTVTIQRNGTDTINGGTNTQLTNAYQSVTLIFNAGNWTII